MKSILLLSLLITSTHSPFASGSNRQVNAIIGDRSFIARFGYSPTNKSSEQLRLVTHLAYVEHLLSMKDVTNLSKQQQRNRKAVIALLHEYWNRGIFPSNYDYPNERRPCFIDRNGNICAVGYLIEKTIGRKAAEQINAKHQYDYLLDMHVASINSWANENGLSLLECAMIQPTYFPSPAPITTSAGIETNYGIHSGVISGINLAATIANFSIQSHHSSTVALIGLITGTTQILLGATNIKKPSVSYRINGPQTTTTYEAQNNLSYFNLAMGTTTVISSAIRLLTSKKNKEARNAYNIFSYPNQSNSLTFGVGLKRRI